MLLIDGIKDLIERNTKYLPLSPQERAFVHWTEEVAISVATGAIIAGVQYFFSGGTDASLLLHIVEYAAIKEIFSAVWKYAQARGDFPLADALQAMEPKVLEKVADKADHVNQPPEIK